MSRPWAAPWLTVAETHSGVVVLSAGRAHKVKKPVVTEFLDFSTPARRRAALDRELALNRRIAPDVYLGVVEVDDPLGGEAEPVLVMHRMPDELRLSTVVTQGRAVDAHLVALARLVANFHGTARRGPEVDAEGGVDALRERWSDNVEQARDVGVLDAGVLDEVAQRVGQFLGGRGPLLALRVAQGCIVDGHADLTAQDVFCLPDGPRVLDCLDFDDRLRFVDRIDDVAFLAMDLEHLGRPGLAADFLHDYAQAAGVIVAAPASLVHHYVAYRAFVRAKIECLQHTQGRSGSAERAGGYAELALRHLRSGRCVSCWSVACPGPASPPSPPSWRPSWTHGCWPATWCGSSSGRPGRSRGRAAPRAGVRTPRRPRTRCSSRCSSRHGRSSASAARWCWTPRGPPRPTGAGPWRWGPTPWP